MICPIKNGKNTLPRIFFEQKDTGFFILWLIGHQIYRFRSLAQACHVYQICILYQCKPLRFISEHGQIIPNLIHATRYSCNCYRDFGFI